MDNTPKTLQIEQLKSYYFEMKTSYAKKAPLLLKRDEIEESLVSLPLQTFASSEQNKERQLLKKQLLELDHQLDVTEEVNLLSLDNLEDDLVEKLMRDSKKEHTEIELSRKEKKQLQKTIKLIRESKKAFLPVQQLFLSILSAYEGTKQRSFLHYVFGKSPYLLINKRMKATHELTLEALEIFQDKAINSSLFQKSKAFMEKLSLFCKEEWTTQKIENIGIPLEEEMGHLLKEWLHLEEQSTTLLIETQKKIDNWIQ